MAELKISELTGKVDTALATAKKAWTEINCNEAQKNLIHNFSIEVRTAKGKVAEFGALALLHNP